MDRQRIEGWVHRRRQNADRLELVQVESGSELVILASWTKEEVKADPEPGQPDVIQQILNAAQEAADDSGDPIRCRLRWMSPAYKQTHSIGIGSAHPTPSTELAEFDRYQQAQARLSALPDQPGDREMIGELHRANLKLMGTVGAAIQSPMQAFDRVLKVKETLMIEQQQILLELRRENEELRRKILDLEAQLKEDPAGDAKAQVWQKLAEHGPAVVMQALAEFTQNRALSNGTGNYDGQ